MQISDNQCIMWGGGGVIIPISIINHTEVHPRQGCMPCFGWAFFVTLK